MFGWPRSTLCMASRAPRIVEDGVADASPEPATNSGSAAVSGVASTEVSDAMWMICAAQEHPLKAEI